MTHPLAEQLREHSQYGGVPADAEMTMLEAADLIDALTGQEGAAIRLEDYRSGYSCGYSDAKAGTAMRDEAAGRLFFGMPEASDNQPPCSECGNEVRDHRGILACRCPETRRAGQEGTVQHTGGDSCRGGKLFGTSASCPVCWGQEGADPPRICPVCQHRSTPGTIYCPKCNAMTAFDRGQEGAAPSPRAEGSTIMLAVADSLGAALAALEMGAIGQRRFNGAVKAEIDRLQYHAKAEGTEPAAQRETLECSCCGDVAAIGPEFTDGQPLLCGCKGWISCDSETEPWVNASECECGGEGAVRYLRKKVASLTGELEAANQHVKILQELAAQREGAAPCEGTCNPFKASCGAPFCTYEEMHQHNRQHREGAAQEPPQQAEEQKP